MKYIFRLFCAAFAGVLLLWSCAEKYEDSDPNAENKALGAWMKIHHPDLLENYQEDGAYYVDIIEEGDLETAITDSCWVRFEFTGRGLQGNICLTRDSMNAKLEGSFSRYTHYVPFFRTNETSSGSLMEGTYLVMNNLIKLGEKYASDRDLPRELTLHLGSELDIYMPSSIVGDGLSGDGGYEGQYALSSGRPLIVRMKITDIIRNPLEDEGTNINAFAEDNGGLRPLGSQEPEDKYAWRNAYDSIPHVYINRTFRPGVRQDSLFKFINPYFGSQTDNMEARINEALLKRFGPGVPTVDTVGLTGKAKVWYICRFLDGFIADTNIKEVQKIIYGKAGDNTTVVSYTPETSKGSYIEAWYYSIPKLRFGQWAAMTTISSYAYGTSGKSGSKTTTSSTSTDYSDVLNYYNYNNSYYGGMNYGGYYNNYYNNYNGGYYSGTTATSSVKNTTTSVTTEIQAYTPLIFELYIEPES